MKGIQQLAVAGIACSAMAWAQAQERVVVLSSDVADIVVALKAEKMVVGKDSLSKAPSLAHAKDIGMFRNLSAEPIIALKPSLVLGSFQAQPSSIYQQLSQHKVRAANVMATEDEKSFSQGIVKIGEFLGKANEAKALSAAWSKQMQPRLQTGKRYVFTYDGQIVAGKNTVSDTLIRLAGGINAAAHMQGLKPVTREAWVAMKPDVVVITQHSLAMVGGSVTAFGARPELKNSAAAKQQKIVALSAGEAFGLDLNSPKVVDRLHALAR
jgi:iron complex transport system substrate-binding protein